MTHQTYDVGYIMFSRCLTAPRCTKFPGRFLGTLHQHPLKSPLTVGIASQAPNCRMETHLLELPIPAQDIAFGLMGDFDADLHPNKVSLIAGAYRDENGKPWIFPSVRMVRSADFRCSNLDTEDNYRQRSTFVTSITNIWESQARQRSST